MSNNKILQILKSLLNTEGVEATDSQIDKASAWALGNDKVDIADMQLALLQPITETLGNSGVVPTHYFLPQPLTLQKGKEKIPLFFPKEEKPNITQLSDYVKHFETDINSWASLDYYGSSIACDKSFQDISLFDFIKTTTALTDILTQDESMVIVCGNVSGIQTYIYDIISRSAAKNMKGRSFYVQLLTETILQLTLDKLGLKFFHVLYSSGGGFYILSPTSKVLKQETIDSSLIWVEQDTFTTLRQDINTVLRDEHGLSLSFDLLNSDIIKPEDKDFSKKWSEIFRRGEKAKMRRHATSLNEDTFKAFFEPQEIGGEQERDVITNEEFKKEEDKYYVDESEKTLPIRKITKQQIELGRALRKADYWTTTRNSLKGTHQTVERKEFQLYNWDVYHNFSEKSLTVSNSNLIAQRTLNTPSVKTDFTYYGGNDVPRYDKDNVKGDAKVGDPKFFEDLAQGIDFDRLGILRMDVDSLGSQIQGGISNPCFARLSTLSRSLDYFFKGFLNTLWSDKEKDKYRKEYSFILYSGGDDLFILGRWDVIMTFALDIQHYFTDWVCHNPELTISGGVVLVPSKFPIVQAAALAKTAEKKAKEHEREGKSKNAFCFLNTPLDWDYEMKLVLDLKKQLLSLLKNGSISKSLLDKINAYASTRKIQKDNKKTERWRWVMAYDLTRYSQTLKDDDAKLFVQQIYTAAHANTDLSLSGKIKSDYAFIELLQIAARWAEFDYRTEK